MLTSGNYDREIGVIVGCTDQGSGNWDFTLDANKCLSSAPAENTTYRLIPAGVLAAYGLNLTSLPWNSSWDAQVESEVNDALVALNLDHLCKTATAAADMTTEVADILMKKSVTGMS